MTTDYEHLEEVEIAVGDNVSVFEILIGLRCTARSEPAVLYQRNGDPGWPAEDAEFDLTEIQIKSTVPDAKWLVVPHHMIGAVMGEEILEEVIGRAFEGAYETGEF